MDLQIDTNISNEEDSMGLKEKIKIGYEMPKNPIKKKFNGNKNINKSKNT